MNTNRFFEPVSPQAPDVLTEYDVERLNEVERMMTEIDNDFKKRDMNNLCLRTAAALHPEGRASARNLGSYIFPKEHANIHSHTTAAVPPSTRQSATMESSMDEMIRKIIHATVYQTVEKLHEDGLIVCKNCVIHRR